MKLKFIKNKDNDFSVKIIDGKKIQKFDYIQFIDKTYKDKKLENPIFQGDFYDDEKERIVEMVDDLRKIIVPNSMKKTKNSKYS